MRLIRRESSGQLLNVRQVPVLWKKIRDGLKKVSR